MSEHVGFALSLRLQILVVHGVFIRSDMQMETGIFIAQQQYTLHNLVFKTSGTRREIDYSLTWT
jgi:hypothetical protein